jgi:hypothetical protein
MPSKPKKMIPAAVTEWLRNASPRAIVAALVTIDPAKAAQVGVDLYLHGAGTVGSVGDQVMKEVKEHPGESLGRVLVGGLGALLGRPR